MPLAQMMKNTDKDYPCTNCGDGDTSIVREGANPRLKCNRCNFTFNGSDSVAAKEAGVLPDGPPEIQDTTIPEPAPEAERSSTNVPSVEGGTVVRSGLVQKVPRSPSHVFLSKKRDKIEFCTNKDLKRVAVKWQYENVPHDVFELTLRKVQAKVTISDA